VLSVIALSLAPLLFGISGLDSTASAVPLEGYVSLIGIALLTPIFHPELNSAVREVVSSKYAGRSRVYLIRTIYAVVALLALIGLFILYMKYNGCQVSFSLLIGTFANAAFLGSLGMLASVLARNIAASYMLPVGYYAMNLMGGLRLGKLDLFSMMNGHDELKMWLLASSAIAAAASIMLDRCLR